MNRGNSQKKERKMRPWIVSLCIFLMLNVIYSCIFLIKTGDNFFLLRVMMKLYEYHFNKSYIY